MTPMTAQLQLAAVGVNASDSFCVRYCDRVKKVSWPGGVNDVLPVTTQRVSE